MPSRPPCWTWRLARSVAGDVMRVHAIGFVEVVGMVAAIEAGDAMVKAASVRLLKQHVISPGWITVVVEGDLASCRAAVDAGKAAAARVGKVLSTLVLGRPDVDTEGLVLDLLCLEPEYPSPPSGGARKPRSGHGGSTPTKNERAVHPVAVATVSIPPLSELPLLPAGAITEAAPGVAFDESVPDVPRLSDLAAVQLPPGEGTVAVRPVGEPPSPETLLAYIAATARGRTCQDVARRFHMAPAAAREILDQWVGDGRLDKTGSRYFPAHRLI